MTTKLPSLKALFVALLLSASAAAHADVTILTSRADFPAAITGPIQSADTFGGSFFGSNAAGAFIPNTNVALTATDGSITRTFTLGNTTPDSFIGFVSSQPVTAVTFNTDGANYWATANNPTLAVPEADTYIMLLAGLLVMGWLIQQHDS